VSLAVGGFASLIYLSAKMCATALVKHDGNATTIPAGTKFEATDLK
jgi:hypothetical protein